MKWVWPAVFALLVTAALSPALVTAQEPAVRVSSTGPFPLLIDGERETAFPAIASVGSQACIVTNPGYLSEVERLAFLGWSHGPKGICVTFAQPGDYSALYEQEVLLTVNSQVREFRESKWVPKGVPVLLTVPAVVNERPGVRYLFEEWNIGEVRFKPDNKVVPNRPLTIEVRWSKEYFLELTGPENVRLVGGGWHREGANVVLKAPATAFSIGEDQRLQFGRWEVISNPAIIIPNQQTPTTSIKMDDAHTIQAIFDVGFRVIVENPQGTQKKDWFPQGTDVEVETPEFIEISPGLERLAFKRWEGTDLPRVKGFITVKGPVTAKALYDTQFMVEVDSPYGVSGAGWYKEGEIATISVPESPSSVFFLKRQVNGYDDYPGSEPDLQVPVTRPLALTATYNTGVDFRFLAIAIVLILGVAAIYLITQREYNRRKRRAPL